MNNLYSFISLIVLIITFLIIQIKFVGVKLISIGIGLLLVLLVYLAGIANDTTLEDLKRHYKEFKEGFGKGFYDAKNDMNNEFKDL